MRLVTGVASVRQQEVIATPPLVFGHITISVINLSNLWVFFVNMHVKLLSSEAFISPKCSKYRSMAGLHIDPVGDLQRPHDTLAGLRGRTSKGRGT